MAECKHENIMILAQAEIPAEMQHGNVVPNEEAGFLKVEWLFCTECKTKIEPTQDQVADIVKALAFGDGFVV